MWTIHGIRKTPRQSNIEIGLINSVLGLDSGKLIKTLILLIICANLIVTWCQQ